MLKIKKISSLLVFIYHCCIPLGISILRWSWRNTFGSKVRTANDQILPKFSSDFSSSIPEKPKEFFVSQKDEIENLVRSFSEKISKYGGYFEEKELDSILKKLETASSKSEEELSKLMLNVYKEMEKEDWWRSNSYIPANVRVKYNKEKQSWETKKLKSFELAWEEPSFFFLVKPMNRLSKNLLSFLGIHGNKNYFVYFHLDIIIKSLIVNFFIKFFLLYFSENYFDRRNSPLLKALSEVLVSYNFVYFISEDILLKGLPNFWKQNSFLVTNIIFVFYEGILSWQENFENIFPLVMLKLVLAWLAGNSKRRVIANFFINSLISEKLINKIYLWILGNKSNPINTKLKNSDDEEEENPWVRFNNDNRAEEWN